MSESLRDQLLKAGFSAKPQSASARKDKPAAKPARKAARGAAGKVPAAEGEIDLARAYALRERDERAAREREQREAAERARERKERRQKLAQLLAGKELNEKDADIPRHFPYGNRIRRIWVTAEQLPRLNGGELAVVQMAGRYLLVPRETALAAQAIDPEALALLCDPHAAADDDVPPDLIW